MRRYSKVSFCRSSLTNVKNMQIDHKMLCAAHCTRLFHYPDCAGYTTENMNQSKETAASGSKINVCQARRNIGRTSNAQKCLCQGRTNFII